MAMSMNRIAYGVREICNPLTFERLDHVLARAGLRPGARALDIGTGNGMVAAHIAETFGLEITALERDPEMAALARERTKGRGAPGSLSIETVESGDYLSTIAPVHFISALGTTGAAGRDERDAERTFRTLAQALEPGGWLFWADVFWARPPSDPMRQIIGITNHFESHQGWIEAGRAAGLEPFYATTSPQQDWDDLIWDTWQATEAWVRANPERPEGAMLLMRARMIRDMFIIEGRETMGFGLYLFRKAPA